MTLKIFKKSKTNALMLLALLMLLYKLVHLNVCMYIAHRQYSPVQFFYCNIWNDTDEMILIIIFLM